MVWKVTVEWRLLEATPAATPKWKVSIKIRSFFFFFFPLNYIYCHDFHDIFKAWFPSSNSYYLWLVINVCQLRYFTFLTMQLQRWRDEAIKCLEEWTRYYLTRIPWTCLLFLVYVSLWVCVFESFRCIATEL